MIGIIISVNDENDGRPLKILMLGPIPRSFQKKKKRKHERIPVIWSTLPLFGHKSKQPRNEAATTWVSVSH